MRELNIKKPYKIFAKIIDEKALEQFEDAMSKDFVVQWALMPDAHWWYSLPIWWVVSTKWVIVPARVWYDIWCWMSAIKTKYKKHELNKKEELIFKSIYRSVPTWDWNKHKKIQKWDYKKFVHTELVDDLIDKWYFNQLWTLWWGNHFIEISCDEQNYVWIIVHSWSRWFWHKIATHYMDIAKTINSSKDIVWIREKIEIEFDWNKEYEKLKTKDPEKYFEIKWMWVENTIKDLSNWKKSIVWQHFWLDCDSIDWKNYIMDMNFALEFALENRKRMILATYNELSYYIDGIKNICEDCLSKKNYFINRNHNHAEFKDWVWIHRKWATHAEKWMRWVIPWNMRDWVFVVVWKWNQESMNSSSHGAWRVMSRSKANENIIFSDFKKTMKKSWIIALVTEKTKDESPFAYKDIFEVMKLQKELVDVKYYLKPIINVKW